MPANLTLTPAQLADLRWTANFLDQLAKSPPNVRLVHYQEQLAVCAGWLREAAKEETDG